jgi:hypothetical protein
MFDDLPSALWYVTRVYKAELTELGKPNENDWIPLTKDVYLFCEKDKKRG